jgi:hypothetical protein
LIVAAQSQLYSSRVLFSSTCICMSEVRQFSLVLGTALSTRQKHRIRKRPRHPLPLLSPSTSICFRSLVCRTTTAAHLLRHILELKHSFTQASPSSASAIDAQHPAQCVRLHLGFIPHTRTDTPDRCWPCRRELRSLGPSRFQTRTMSSSVRCATTTARRVGSAALG